MNKSVNSAWDYSLSRWEKYPPLTGNTRIWLVVLISVTLVVGCVGNILVLVLFSNRWDMYPPMAEETRKWFAILVITVLVNGFVGNAVVVGLFIKYRSLRTTANMFVINLTVGDLMMCVTCLPLIINNCLSEPMYDEIGYLLCNFDAFLGAYTGFVSILSLAALAIDRCYVISRQIPILFNDNKTHVYVAIAFIWIVAGGGASMPIFGFGKYVQDGSRMFCSFDFFTRSLMNIAYNITIQVLYFGLPVTAIIACYVIIFLKVRSHENKYFRHKEGGTFDEVALRRMRKNRKYEKNELKTARAGIVLITVFCMSWLPYSIVSLIALYGDSSIITPLAVAIPAVFAKLSTILNPVLYALIHKRFKRKLGLFVQKYFDLLKLDTSNSSNNRRLNEYPGQTTGNYNSIRSYLVSTRNQNISTV